MNLLRLACIIVNHYIIEIDFQHNISTYEERERMKRVEHLQLFL